MGIGAVACAYAAIAVCVTIKNFWAILVLIWFVLCFGGAIVPGVTGEKGSACHFLSRKITLVMTSFSAAHRFVLG